MTGRVYLVGAGPGDPGLITVAGLERIKAADVIVYDRLASERLLDRARPDAELIFVGKGGGESADQADINAALVTKAREGKTVVRLKGGDPYVFGRGGEEGEALRAAGIPFDVVPGVTSAVAVPAYAGIPVTHRGVASSFAVVTGHEAGPEPGGSRSRRDAAKDDSSINWEHLAQGVDTLVFLMGVTTLPEIVERLVANGRPTTTPAAVVHRGTTPGQRTVTGTLADIVDAVRDAGIAAPAITVVGEVVRLRDTLLWFEDRPLFGKRVLITRTRKQASVLAKLLADEGAVPVELPAIEIMPAEDDADIVRAIGGLLDGDYSWTVFTSANAVELWFDAIRRRGLDARAFGSTQVAAIGPATAKALAKRGITADLMPTEYVAESVLEALLPLVEPGSCVLLPRAEAARAELVEGLLAARARADEVALYSAEVPAEVPPGALADLREGRIDIVTFTASSTVRNLVALLGGDTRPLHAPLIACIGPITAKTAEELGLRVDVMAPEHTVPGLVEALKEALHRWLVGRND